jgi:hypothetical protein
MTASNSIIPELPGGGGSGYKWRREKPKVKPNILGQPTKDRGTPGQQEAGGQVGKSVSRDDEGRRKGKEE